MNVWNFLFQNWDSILVATILIIGILILVKRGETKILKQILFGLVTQAEQEYGDGTGKLKYAKVADWIYQRIPAVLKVLFTAKDLEKLIEEALDSAKTAWDSNDRLLEAGVITSTAVLIDSAATADEPSDENDMVEI